MGHVEAIVAISSVILVILVVRAVFVWRAERGQPRGAAPGRGDHVIDASYTSGGAGGGHTGHFTVPRDPQDYARRFVPRR